MSHAVGRRRYLTNFDVHRLPHLFTDVLVIGSGVAGLRAALAAAEGANVLLVTKAKVSDSSTSWAQGGIAAVVSPGDEPERHAQDTIAVACGLADEPVVRSVVGEAPAHIDELREWGAAFDREGDMLAAGREGAHTAPRVVHANGDATGRELVRVLVAHARKHPRIRIFEHCFTIDLITVDGEAVGAITQHAKHGHQMFWATTTILATGGVGRVYRETTNPPVATGDGLAMAFRAGVTLRDMEMVQFHPTTLYIAGAARALISEAVRGEGAYLVNAAGERFMASYDPRAELASRDIVSRAITAEMAHSHASHVYLDVRHFAAGRFAERFPNIAQLCRDFDINPETDLIPVRPSAHYGVGGIVVDTRGGTELPGLLACGEATSTGLHGANRLASNSLLEGLVYGKRAGEYAAQRSAGTRTADRPKAISHIVPKSPRTELDVRDVLSSLQSIMSRNVAIERTADRLRETIEIIDFWGRYVMDKVFDTPSAWETQNTLTVALCIASSAAARCESRGVHYRQDFPETEEEWRCHVDVCRAEDDVRLATTALE